MSCFENILSFIIAGREENESYYNYMGWMKNLSDKNKQLKEEVENAKEETSEIALLNDSVLHVLNIRTDEIAQLHRRLVKQGTRIGQLTIQRARMVVKIAEREAVLREFAEECPDLDESMEGNDEEEEEEKSTSDAQGNNVIDDLLARIKQLEQKNEHWIEEVAAQEHHYGAIIQRQQQDIELRDKKDHAVALALTQVRVSLGATGQALKATDGLDLESPAAEFTDNQDAAQKLLDMAVAIGEEVNKTVEKKDALIEGDLKKERQIAVLQSSKKILQQRVKKNELRVQKKIICNSFLSKQNKCLKKKVNQLEATSKKEKKNANVLRFEIKKAQECKLNVGKLALAVLEKNKKANKLVTTLKRRVKTLHGSKLAVKAEKRNLVQEILSLKEKEKDELFFIKHLRAKCGSYRQQLQDVSNKTEQISEKNDALAEQLEYLKEQSRRVNAEKESTESNLGECATSLIETAKLLKREVAVIAQVQSEIQPPAQRPRRGLLRRLLCFRSQN